jgi:hypothetical protein
LIDSGMGVVALNAHASLLGPLRLRLVIADQRNELAFARIALARVEGRFEG